MGKTKLGKKYLISGLSLIGHLIAIGLVVYLVRPIAQWYLDQIPVRGIDLYLSVSYVSQLLKDFSFRFNGWKDIWFSGVPSARDYPSLYFYLMIPFAKQFGLVGGVQMFAVAGLFVFAAFSYLLYHQLSRNRVLAVVLTVTTLFSVNLYRALIWAGGIPFWTTQAFFPIVIFLVAKYCRTRNSKWLYLAALAAGLGIKGHPQNFINVILPAAGLILFFWRPAEKKTRLKTRFFDLLRFGGTTVLIGLSEIAYLTPASLVTDLINTLLRRSEMSSPASTGGTAVPLETIEAIEGWTRRQFSLVWLDSHQLLWHLLAIGLGLFAVSLLFRKQRGKALVSLVPFGATAGLVVGLVFLFSRGINLFVSGWYKAFWPVLAGVATLTAFLWGEAGQGLAERKFWQKKGVRFLRLGGSLAVSLILAYIGFRWLIPARETTIKGLARIDQFSSAYPEILNVKTSEEDLLVLKEEFKPELMTGDPRDFRLYVIDATVNIWWGALEEMPLARGYIDPPLSMNERWGLFWLDAALGPTLAGPKNSLIEDWDVPEEISDNNVRFLLDWYATRYLEGNHLGAAGSNFASNVTTEKFIEATEEVFIKGGIVDRYMAEERWSDDEKQFLKFYRVKEELVSPILMATDAVPVMHVGKKGGYETLTRLLGALNLGPRELVLVRGPVSIDELSFSDLSNFEALILYQYDYQNYDQAWKLIGKYLEKGGRVFIDTGSEVKESDTVNLYAEPSAELPGVFPIKRTVREDLGREWEPQAVEGPAAEGVDFSQFSPLVFDETAWNISHPLAGDDLRENSQVLLRHQGTPVVVAGRFGEGKVIWSGYNLPFHATRYHNWEEGEFFENLLGELIDLTTKPVLATGSWISPRERVIEVDGAKGVVFKEQAFAGWKAGLGRKGLEIYKAGPSSPGFIYVKLPEGARGEVKFKYQGALSGKVYSAISWVVILFIVDFLFGGRVLIALSRRLTSPARKRAGKWWEREEDY